MSYNTELQSNNTDLQSILDTINALPEAGSGGGTSVETCTVNVFSATSTAATTGISVSFLAYTSYTNGQSSGVIQHPSTVNETTFDTVVCPSLIVAENLATSLVASGDCTVLYNHTNGGSGVYTSYIFVQGDCSINFVKSNPCFVRGTHIILANRLTKEVQDITYDDDLLVWDFDNGCYATAKPLWIKKSQVSSYYYRCEFEDGTVLKLVGSNGKCHRVFNADANSFESATDCVGNRVVGLNGITKLMRCERVEETVEFYNIITNHHMNLFANSILTSCRLNNLYRIEDMKFVKEDRDTITIDKYTDIDDNFYVGLRLFERKPEDIDSINDYAKNLYLLWQRKETNNDP